MATTLELRNQIGSLVGLAAVDLAFIWREVEEAAAAEEPLRDVLPALIDTYGLAAASVAAEWYDEARDDAAIAGRFTAVIPAPGELGAQELVGWALAEAQSLETLRGLVEGGMQRRIANQSRGVVAASSTADPRADGWQRVTNGECCGFCRMLTARAELYRSEDTARFGAHDGCDCGAAPAWGGQVRPVRAFTPSDRDITAADRKRLRDWLKANDFT